MEENNRKKKSIFYIAIGVISLIVTVLGVTVAYFSASTDTNNNTIAGQTASAANITLNVLQVSPSELTGKSGKIIPLESGETNTGEGAEEYENKMQEALKNDCIYNGYVACQVYRITVTNSGSDPVTATPKIKLTYNSGFENLRWQKLTGTSSSDFAVTGTSVKNHNEYTSLDPITNLTSSTTSGNVQYIVVWLEETGLVQNETGLEFNGTVTVDVLDINNNPLEEKLTAFLSGNNDEDVMNEGTAATYITNLYKDNNPTEIINYQEDEEIEQARYYYSYMDEDNTWGLMNDGLGATVTDATALKNATQGNIRYFGKSPNNYVYFNCDDYTNQYYEDETTGKKNCERWRIIGVFDNKLKIISDDTLGTYSWDYTSTGSYNNNWHDSTLMTLLNNEYYNNSDGVKYYNYSTTPITINFKQDNKGLKNIETQDMISESAWYLGGHNSSSIYSDDIYGYERGDAISSNTSKIWEGKIALMYPSDYGYAADLSKCNKTLYNYYPSTNCKGTDWLYNNDYQWLLTPHLSLSRLALYVGSGGTVENGYYVRNVYGVRPVLYLNSELVIESGEGTKERPYVLG